MTTNAYDIGDLVRLSVAFTDVDGDPVDPTTIALQVQLPDGEVETYTGGELTKDSVGNYHYDLSIEEAGYYQIRWAGTGAAQAADQSRIWARASNIEA